MKLTKKEAKELAVKKWEYIVENYGSSDGLTVKYPEFRDMTGRCPYCELWFFKKDKNNNYCVGCPIKPRYNKNYNKEQSGCRQINHPFLIWCENKISENAQKVLDLIK